MKNSPLNKQKRGMLSTILDPANIHKKSEGAPAIVPGSDSAFKMRGYPYPGKSPLNKLDDPSAGDQRHAIDGSNDDLVEGETKGKWSDKIKNFAKSDFVKDVAVGTVVSLLSKEKKKFVPVNITEKQHKIM